MGNESLAITLSIKPNLYLMKTNISVAPSRRFKTSLSTWEVRDNKGKLVGTFDANKDKTGDKYEKLTAIAQIRNIAHDLFDVRQSIKSLIHDGNVWQIRNRASQAFSQTKDAIAELDLIIDHIKQS